MSARRTEVTVDVLVGEIHYRGGRVEIPAELNIDGGGGGRGGRGGSGGGGGGRGGGSSRGPDGLGTAGAIAGILGQRGLQSIIANIRTIVAAASSLNVYLVGIIALAGAAVVAFRMGFGTIMRLAQGALAVVRGVLSALWEGTVKLAEGFFDVGRAIMQGTLTALQSFAETVQKVLEQALEAVQRFVEQAVLVFAELEQAVASTVAVMGRFGEAGMVVRDTVMDMALSMSSASRFSATDLAKSMQEVAKAGYESEASLLRVADAGRILAEATGEDVVSTTETLIKVHAQFRLAADDALTTANMLAAAANQSLASVKSLSEALKYAGPMSAMLGNDLSETLAALMAFENLGQGGSTAGTQLSNMFNAIIKQTDKARAEFNAFGIDLSKIDITKMGIIDIVEWAEGLEKKVGRSNMINLLFGPFEVRAARGFLALLTVGADKLRQMQGAITGTNDALNMQREQMNTLQGAWAVLTHLWENLQAKIVRGPLGDALRTVIDLLQGVIKTAESMGIIRQVSLILGALVGVIGGVIARLSGPLLTSLQKILGGIPVVIRQFADALLSVMPRVIAFIETLPAIFGRAFDLITPAVLGFLTTVVPLLLNFAEMALPLLIGIFGSFVSVVTEFLAQNGESLVGWFEAVLRAILGLVQFLPQVLPAVQRLLGTFLELLPALMQAALEALPALLEALVAILPYVQQLASEGVGVLLLALQTVTEMLQGPAQEAARSWLNTLIMVMQFLAQNWPMISALMISGLWIISNLIAVFGNNIMRLLPIVGQFLTYLATNWEKVMGRVADAIETVFKLLGDIAAIIPGLVPLFASLALAIEAVNFALALVFASVASVLEGILGLFITVGLAVGALGESLYELATGQFKEAGETWKQFGKDFKMVWGEIGKSLSGWWGLVGATLKAMPATITLATAATQADKAAKPIREFGRDSADALRNAPGPGANSGVGPGASANSNASASANLNGTRTADLHLHIGEDLKQVVRMTIDEENRWNMQTLRVNGMPA